MSIISELIFVSQNSNSSSLISNMRVHECVLSRSVMSDSATPWTVAHQAPLSSSPGKNTGVGCHALL